MNIAVDATAGERERLSLEPLLINPVPRSGIVLGKWLAAVLFSSIGSLLTLASVVLALQRVPLQNWACNSKWAPPKGRALLFGGGVPTGFDMPVFIDDGRIGNGLTNDGDQIWLLDADGDTADTVLESNWPKDQSLVRSPSATGPFIAHSAVSTAAEAFSPGQAVLQIDTLATTSSDSTTGTDTSSQETTSTAATIDTSATTATPEQTTEIPPVPPPLVFIDEVLADPPTGSVGDANRDGTRHTYEDEFIELVNTGPDTVSLAGWHLSDDDVAPDQRFTFPADARLAPNGRVLLFGGGAPTGFSVPVFVDDGRIGNGLTNGGDQIWLLDANGDTVDTVLQSNWPNDQSLVR